MKYEYGQLKLYAYTINKNYNKIRQFLDSWLGQTCLVFEDYWMIVRDWFGVLFSIQTLI